MLEEGFGAPGATGADQDRDAVAVRLGHLGQRGVEHLDVVAGRVGAALPRRSTPARNSPVLSQNASIG